MTFFLKTLQDFITISQQSQGIVMNTLFKNIVAPLIALFLFISCASQENLVPLTILHWNDFHSKNLPSNVTVKDSVTKRDTTYLIGGTGPLLGKINSIRDEGNRILVLNAGDDFQGTMISSLTNGRSQIELMNIINPDAFVLGNHEFDYGSAKLKKNLELSTFTPLSANIYDAVRKETFVTPYKIMKYKGLSVGIIGLSPPDLENLVVRDSLYGLVVLPTDSVVNHYIGQLRQKKVDLIIVLSHMGSDKDQILADKFREIDLIIGGHDHRPIHRPIKQNRALIAQAGSYGRWLGRIDLVIDTKGDSILTHSGSLLEIRSADIKPDQLAEIKVEEFESTIRSVVSEVIGELKYAWKFTPRGQWTESTSGNWQSDVIREYAQTDIAFQNAGGIRDELQPGPITVGDMWKISPFSNHFVKFSVTGHQLKEMLEFQLGASLREMIQVSGLRVVFDSRRPKGERMLSLEVGGTPLVDSKVYSVATNNYVTSNLMVHFGIDPKSIQFEDLPEIDRNVFIDFIREKKIIEPFLDGRMRDVGREK